MRLEDTYIEDSCDADGTLKRPSVGLAGNIELVLFDEVVEYTEKEARQYRENLVRYHDLHGVCGWVVGEYYADSKDASTSRTVGVIKKVSYIGVRLPSHRD
jgi:hypothetical protein